MLLLFLDGRDRLFQGRRETECLLKSSERQRQHPALAKVWQAWAATSLQAMFGRMTAGAEDWPSRGSLGSVQYCSPQHMCDVTELSAGLVKLHGKYEMDILSFGCGAPQAQQPEHPSFSVRVEPRQEAEGSCTSHAVVVLFQAEQAGPQSTSFAISIPGSGTPCGVQVGCQPQMSLICKHRVVWHVIPRPHDVHGGNAWYAAMLHVCIQAMQQIRGSNLCALLAPTSRIAAAAGDCPSLSHCDGKAQGHTCFAKQRPHGGAHRAQFRHRRQPGVSTECRRMQQRQKLE